MKEALTTEKQGLVSGNRAKLSIDRAIEVMLGGIPVWGFDPQTEFI